MIPCTLRVCPSSPSRAPAGRCGRKKLPFAGYSVVKERPHRSGQPAAGFERRIRRAPSQTLTRLRTRCSRTRRLVENTGLEPVTSWLQTRRSPS